LFLTLVAAFYCRDKDKASSKYKNKDIAEILTLRLTTELETVVVEAIGSRDKDSVRDGSRTTLISPYSTFKREDDILIRWDEKRIFVVLENIYKEYG